MVNGPVADIVAVQRALDDLSAPNRARITTLSLPGPTGESNQLSTYGRGVILCLGPRPSDAERQAEIAVGNECAALIVVPNACREGSISGFLNRDALTSLSGFDAVALWSDADDLRDARRALALRDGPIIPLLCDAEMDERCVLERHVCTDTTASGGNASLLAVV